MFSSENCSVSSNSNKDVSNLRSFNHRHDAIALHQSIKCLGGINLSNDDICTHTSSAFCYTFSAISKSSNNKYFSTDKLVCGAEDGINCGLASSIAIIKHMFCISVIHCNHRKCERAIFCHLLKTDNSRGGLFATTGDVLQ